MIAVTRQLKTESSLLCFEGQRIQKKKKNTSEKEHKVEKDHRNFLY